MKYGKQHIKRLLYGALLLTALGFLLSGCDAFIIPLGGRVNPADPANPVPIVTDFTLSQATSDNLTFSFTPQANTAGGFPSLLIVLNTSGVPANIQDGTTVAELTLSADTITVTVGDLPESSTYYFSAWTYGESAGETLYTGPVSLTVQRVTGSVTLETDGFVDDFPNMDFFSPDFFAGMTAYQTNALIRFADVPSNTVMLSATFTVTCNGSPATTQSIELKNIIQSWSDTSISYFQSDDPGFSESISNGIQTFGPGFSGLITWDVTEIFANLNQGGYHYGFLIKGPTAEAFSFAASENVPGSGPTLNIDYYLLP